LTEENGGNPRNKSMPGLIVASILSAILNAMPSGNRRYGDTKLSIQQAMMRQGNRAGDRFFCNQRLCPCATFSILDNTTLVDGPECKMQLSIW
jgi:hypothetical protein